MWIKDDVIKLQKKRVFNDSFNHIVDPKDDNELDVFLEYSLLYVINGFKSQDKWCIFKQIKQKA